MNVAEQAQIFNKKLRFFCDTTGKTLAMDSTNAYKQFRGATCWILPVVLRTVIATNNHGRGQLLEQLAAS